ncbi:hypothetical protein [Winogradskyella sp.]|uniref:hypothetical protein n=1 Tax=Winogradskyella sp. TaxID=1883156 RepID=UPI003BAACD78
MKNSVTYENEIKEKYLIDNKSGKLTGNLHKLTPNNVRKVCLNLFDSDLSTSDRSILKNFFGPNEDDSLRNVIKKYDLEKLRPICNFLKKREGSIQSSDALELIALMIDFKPRPYNKYIVEKEEIEEELDSKGENDDDDTIVILPIDLGGDKSKVEDIGYENDKKLSEPNEIPQNRYNRIIIYIRKNSLKILLITILIAGILIIIPSFNSQRWMIWQEDHYVEVKFDLEKYSISQLKLYKEERIEKFKKINPDCKYEFFNKDGSVRVWYGKNIKKELQFFTDYGLHPETGKTLKPITDYMINKYLCNNE